MAKEKYKFGIYLRFGSKVYTSFAEMEHDRQREIAKLSMTPEQIEFCEAIKSEMENCNCLTVRRTFHIK